MDIESPYSHKRFFCIQKYSFTKFQWIVWGWRVAVKKAAAIIKFCYQAFFLRFYFFQKNFLFLYAALDSITVVREWNTHEKNHSCGIERTNTIFSFCLCMWMSLISRDIWDEWEFYGEIFFFLPFVLELHFISFYIIHNAFWWKIMTA